MYVKQEHELCPLTLRYEVTTQQWIQDRLYSIHFLYDQSFPKPDSQFQGCCKVGILKEGKAHHFGIIRLLLYEETVLILAEFVFVQMKYKNQVFFVQLK